MEYLRYFFPTFNGHSNFTEQPDKLKADVDARNPNKAWQKRLAEQHCSFVVPMNPRVPAPEGHVRFVCISDTHGKLEKLKSLDIPDGDVLLHAGDFSMKGSPDEIHLVNEYLGSLPHKHKVVIAGNHEMTFDLDLMNYSRSSMVWSMVYKNYEHELRLYGASGVHDLLTNCIYLQDSMVELYGIKIYGSPWTPSPHRTWGFQLSRGEALLEKWNEIPADTDILLTHCPPCGMSITPTSGGYGDTPGCISKILKMLGFSDEDHYGCVDLLNTVQNRVKPRYHVYGHIHGGYGVRTDGTTIYINASSCTQSYEPTNPAIVFDVPVPPGYSERPEPIGTEQP